MTSSKCRICKGDFFSQPLLRQNKMPKAAQHLPNSDEIKNERGVNLEIQQCSRCALVQLSNEPVPYFREVIRSSAFSKEMKTFREHQFKLFVENFSLANKKVIEIGCGKGEYLSLMKEFKIKAYGLEFAEDSVNACIKSGLNVFKLYLEDEAVVINESPFDAFFILNFFEHVPDPNTMLSGIYNNLSDDGIGLVEVPNFDMMLNNNLFSEFIGDHLFYFTKETLINTLSQNGFEVLSCAEVWYDYIISAVVKKRKKTDVSGFLSQQEKITQDIKKYISQFNKVAVWGAGHQSFAILSLCELSGEIEYIIDDATFKQNKFSPATHIPILSSDALLNQPVEAILVMAASYSDEVYLKIRNKFDSNISVAILRDYGLEVK